MDVVDTATRSRMMSGIRSKDTKPEIALRHAMHRLGFRYRLHSAGLVGRPDLVFPKHKAVVFVHGCFWHRHHDCRLTSTPSTRPEFWAKKFSTNVERDIEVRLRLGEAGWRVAVMWECALKRADKLEMAASQLADWLRTDINKLEVGAEDLWPSTE
ncbi:MAG: very short patch repair endonuclease [Devosia sp.]|jgi:DNA mismatch endonuclease (patch repair protein)|nr:very short patch repair endonuclease [Devosia sp.]